MTKLEEIKKMLEYIAKYYANYYKPIRTRDNIVFDTDAIFSSVDFNITQEEHRDHEYFFIDFGQNIIKMTSWFESGHNGDPYSYVNKEIYIVELENKYDEVRRIFGNAVENQMEKEAYQKKKEAEKAVIEYRMKQILNGE